jgi:hypothetical protein
MAHMPTPRGIGQPGVHGEQGLGRAMCRCLTRDNTGLNAACTTPVHRAHPPGGRSAMRGAFRLWFRVIAVQG